jgi:hypothetical protein
VQDSEDDTKTFRGPVRYSARSIPAAFFLSVALIEKDLDRSKAEIQYKNEIRNVEGQINSYEFLENYESILKNFKDYLPAITFFLSAYLFLFSAASGEVPMMYAAVSTNFFYTT